MKGYMTMSHSRIRQTLADIYERLDDINIELIELLNDYDELIAYNPQKRFEEERGSLENLIHQLSEAQANFEREEGITA